MKRWILVLLAIPGGGALGGFLAAVGTTIIQHLMGGGNSHTDAVDLFGMTVLGGIAGSVLGPIVAFFLTRPADE